MLLEKLVKTHYEIEGNFKNFPYMYLVEKHAGKSDPVDYLYQLLGYKSDGNLSAKDRYYYRKLASEGNTQELKRIFRISKHSELFEVMRRLECASERGLVRPKISTNPVLDSISRVLANYLIKNEQVLLHTQTTSFFASEYIFSKRFRDSRKSLEELLSNPNFKIALQHSIPSKVAYSKGCTPMISQGCLIVPVKLNKQDFNKVLDNAVLHALIRYLDVPEQVYFYLVKEATSYQLDNTTGKYLRLLDWAHCLGKTVKELFELCGLSYVNRIKHISEYHIIAYILSNGRYQIYSLNHMTNYVILSEKQFKTLLETDSLKTLSWDGEGPYIYYDTKRYLKDIFQVQANQDFSGGF